MCKQQQHTYCVLGKLCRRRDKPHHSSHALPYSPQSPPLISACTVCTPLCMQMGHANRDVQLPPPHCNYPSQRYNPHPSPLPLPLLSSSFVPLSPIACVPPPFSMCSVGHVQKVGGGHTHTLFAHKGANGECIQGVQRGVCVHACTPSPVSACPPSLFATCIGQGVHKMAAHNQVGVKQ